MIAPTQNLYSLNAFSKYRDKPFYDVPTFVEEQLSYKFNMASPATKQQVEFLTHLASQGLTSKQYLIDLFLNHNIDEPKTTTRILDCLVRALNLECQNLFRECRNEVWSGGSISPNDIFPLALDFRYKDCVFAPDIDHAFYGLRFDNMDVSHTLLDVSNNSSEYRQCLSSFFCLLDFKHNAFMSVAGLVERTSETSIEHIWPPVLAEELPNGAECEILSTDKLSLLANYLDKVDESTYDFEIAFRLLINATALRQCDNWHEKMLKYRDDLRAWDDFEDSYDAMLSTITDIVLPDRLSALGLIGSCFTSADSGFLDKPLNESLNQLIDNLPPPKTEADKKVADYFCFIRPTFESIAKIPSIYYNESGFSSAFLFGLSVDETETVLKNAISSETDFYLQGGEDSWSYIQDPNDVFPFIRFRGWLEGVVSSLKNLIGEYS